MPMAPGWWWVSELKGPAKSQGWTEWHGKPKPGGINSYRKAEALQRARKGKPSRERKAGVEMIGSRNPPVPVSERSAGPSYSFLVHKPECLWHPSNKTSSWRFSVPCNQSPAQTDKSKQVTKKKIKRSELNRWENTHTYKLSMKYKAQALSFFSYQTGKDKKALR